MSATKSFLTYRIDGDVDYEFSIFVYLLISDDDDKDTILVDTGVLPTDSDYMHGRGGRVVGSPGGGPEPIIDGLGAHGLTPDDIDIVIQTHLHHDHAANLDLFPNAEFIVQQSELDAVRDPLPITKGSFIPGTIEFLDSANLRNIDGDYTLNEDIELLFTPGHTEGSQTVIVQTPDGSFALIADLAYCRHNLEPRLSSIVDASGNEVPVTPQDMDYIPPGIHIDIADCYDSIAKIRDVIPDTDRWFPSHDPSILD